MVMREIIAIAKAHWNCRSYAEQVLGLQFHDNRTASPLRSDASNPTSFYIPTTGEYFHDFGAGACDVAHGDVIDLCRYSRHNGDYTQALEELTGMTISRNDIPDYKAKLSSLRSRVEQWHNDLYNHPELIEYLHSRRISDAFIRDNLIGYREYSNRNGQEEQRLIFPYFEGGRVVYHIGRNVRRIDGKDCSSLPSSHPEHRAKYVKMPASEMFPNILWGLETLGRDDYPEDDPRHNTLVIAEGMFDAAAFKQEGYHVLSAITGAVPSHQQQRLLSTAQGYDRVFIIYDSDSAGFKFTQKMCRTLFSNGITFICGHTPKRFAGHDIKDVSDFYTAGGNLADLLTGNDNWGIETPVDGRKALAASFTKPKDFPALREFIAECAKTCDRLDLEMLLADVPATCCTKRHMQMAVTEALQTTSEAELADKVLTTHDLMYSVDEKSFYEFTSGRWEAIDQLIVERYALELMGRKGTAKRAASVMQHVKILTALKAAFNTRHVVNFTNGILLLDEPDAGKRFIPHDKAYYCTHQLPYAYDPEAKAPVWHSFIDTAMCGDTGKIALLQEMAGYMFYAQNSLERLFVLYGTGSNGKSVFMNTLREVVGAENCTSLEPAALASQFDPHMLKDAMVNFCSEVRGTLDEAACARLKAVASGDPIVAAKKGVDAEDFRTRAKWFMAVNSYFTARDVSWGFIRKLLFVTFSHRVEADARDTGLQQRLLKEIPGIFNWAYEGYQRLMANGKFTETADHEERLSQFRNYMNSTNQYAYERLAGMQGREMNELMMYRDYQEWCKSSGSESVRRAAFIQDITAILADDRSDVTVETRERVKWFIFPGADNSEAIILGAPADDEPESGHTTEPLPSAEAAEPQEEEEPDEPGYYTPEHLAKVIDLVPLSQRAKWNRIVHRGELTHYEQQKLNHHMELQLIRPDEELVITEAKIKLFFPDIYMRM